MSSYILQATLMVLLTFLTAECKKPPGYVAPPKEYDPNPPKYQYGYKIQDEKTIQGKDEERDGIYAQGRYYVENGPDSSQSVKYFADEWGYHPVVEYENNGPHSKTRARFVLGEEAIKLKNNQKTFPEDPNDPGIANNLAKLDPSSRNPLSSVKQPVNVNNEAVPQSLIVDPNGNVEEQDPGNHHVSFIPEDQQPQTNAQYVFNYNRDIGQVNIPSSSSHFKSTLRNSPRGSTGGIRNVVILSTPKPEISPKLLFEPAQSSHSDEIGPNDLNNQLLSSDIQTNDPQHSFYHNSANHTTPQVVYFVQHQNTQPEGNFKGVPDYKSVTKDPMTEDQQVIINNHLPNIGEQLPQPEKLILANSEQLSSTNNLNSISTEKSAFDNAIDTKGENGQLFETAALIKSPNKIVQLNQPSENINNIEFGRKIKVHTSTQPTLNKLIESTRHLVSGADVLNINEAVGHGNVAEEEIENSTLGSLLEKYITPSLLHEASNNDINQLQIVSSTTVSPPASHTYTSFLKTPIIAAESNEDKPVTEKTEENIEEYATTARSSLASSTTDFSKGKDATIVTPRPVSSKFLAPITAGIQLQHIEEQIFDDSKTLESEEDLEKENVYVQVQKTIPYYLGMYQYPTEPSFSSNNESETDDQSAVQKATDNIEIGKTLLYFPNQESSNIQPIAELLSQEIQSNQLKNINNIEEQSKDIQEIVTNEQNNQEFHINNLPSEENLSNRQFQVPVEFTKYPENVQTVDSSITYLQSQTVDKVVPNIIKESYPVEVNVPLQVPVPYPVERVIERKIPVPYYIEKPVEKIVEKPIEKIIERKIPVPYYIEKPVERIVEKKVPHYIDRPYPVQVPTSQAYLLQIPGLFSKQKYGNLVRQSYRPEEAMYHFKNTIGGRKQIQDKSISSAYTTQVNHALTEQNKFKDKAERPRQPLRKLNLLVFPGANSQYAQNIPADLQSSQSFRYSTSQLNNGYLPPISLSQNNCKETQSCATQANVFELKKQEDYSGLVPPKDPVSDSSTFRSARSRFDEKSIRMEYGFMPPLIPSLEIDEHGQPIHREDAKI
ncbi:uncharacterized protein LOC115881434 [Sitophilus oryzae]|uniref:Uncharacterized protein LOC115881434 n=1 Tax=Sitophilus oryzae TaxID=7048 RepID=A0A6J2XUQ7_SITOR|nr:uncharacterized protein LOC115881434 [Sitophilus oryzae]